MPDYYQSPATRNPELRIKCIKPGGVTLDGYGQHVFAEGDELDLLDAGTPAAIKAADYEAAWNMARDETLEICQRIAAGEFVIVAEGPGD